ncbi:hypothetical protein BgiMline_034329, partial [Biomphalaria glabrata]
MSCSKHQEIQHPEIQDNIVPRSKFLDSGKHFENKKPELLCDSLLLHGPWEKLYPLVLFTKHDMSAKDE